VERDMNQNKKQEWDVVRNMGLGRFVLKYGVLKFGGSLLLINFVLYNLLFRRNWVVADLIEDFITVALISLAAGLFFGVILWFAKEMRHWW
jgi:hypothetical protein